MKKRSNYNQQTHRQYYRPRSNILIKNEQQTSYSPSHIPVSSTKIKKHRLLHEAEQHRQESNSKVKRQSSSKLKNKLTKLSTNMFKEAHIVKGQTYLTKNYSPNGFKRGESDGKNSKRSGSQHVLKGMNSQSKLQIKKVIQIKVQTQQSDLTRQIISFGNQQQQSLKKRITQIESIPQIPADVQRLASKRQDANQTLLDIMKSF